MATGRVRAGFFHTRTRPAGQNPWPGPCSFRVSGFFPGPRPALAGPHGSRGPHLGLGPNSWPNQKKKKKNLSPDLFFPYVQAQIYFCHSSLHIPNKKIKPKFIYNRLCKPIFTINSTIIYESRLSLSLLVCLLGFQPKHHKHRNQI